MPEAACVRPPTCTTCNGLSFAQSPVAGWHSLGLCACAVHPPSNGLSCAMVACVRAPTGAACNGLSCARLSTDRGASLALYVLGCTYIHSSESHTTDNPNNRYSDGGALRQHYLICFLSSVVMQQRYRVGVTYSVTWNDVPLGTTICVGGCENGGTYGVTWHDFHPGALSNIRSNVSLLGSRR